MFRALLRIRDFRLLWMGQVMSNFGDALTSLALLLLTQRLTGSVAAVAGTAVAIALPQLLFGLLAGAFVDRWDRKRVLIGSDVLRGMLVLGFLMVGSASDLWLLYLIAFAQAAVGTFFNPAKMALIPLIAGREQLLAANSVNQTSQVLFGLLGTATAGVFAGIQQDLSLLFVLDALTFLASAGLEARMSVRGRVERPAPARILEDVLAGLQLIVGSRILIGVVVGAGVLMLGLGSVNVLLVPFIVEVLEVPETWFGAIEASQVVSMVAAGALVATLAQRLSPTRLISLSLIGVGVVVAGVSLVTSPWQLMLALFLAGWFVTPLQASVSSLVQSEVPDELRGRAGSALSTALTGANVASMALAGISAAVLGVRGVFVAAGAIALLAAGLTLVLFRPPLGQVAIQGNSR